MKIHPHDLLLRELIEVLTGEHKRLLAHLLDCGSCRERALPFLNKRSSVLMKRVSEALALGEESIDYDEALRRSGRAQSHLQFSYERERADAKGLLAELAAQPPERQILILENHPRFHSWGLLELLIDQGRDTGYTDPALGEDLCALALRLADQLDPAAYGIERIEDLRARTWASIGNCRRVRSDLRGAGEAMATAVSHLREGTGDLLERATILDLRASLLRAQRRFDQAIRLLRRAFKIFSEYGDTHRAGRALLNLEHVYHAAGTPELGIPLLYRAIKLIDPSEEPMLVLVAWHNLIDDLAEAGRVVEAHGLFTRSRAIYRQFPDAPTQHRRKWVQGKIARGLGRSTEAEALFLAVRDGFLSLNIPYDTALVSLDLASLYAEQGRTAELKALAEAIVPIFSAQGIHREALAALLLLQKAIAAETASLDLLSRIAAYLKRARHDPELRFEVP